MSRSDAVARALAIDPNAKPSSPVFVKQMTLSAYNAMSANRINEPGQASSNFGVWVVTVHAPMYTDGAPFSPPRLMHAYTVIFDAENGWGIDTCIGCATLG